VSTYKSHLELKADRIMELESDIEQLKQSPNTEVWLLDYMMTIKLRGTYEETEMDFLLNDTANNLGIMRVYADGGKIWREYWNFIFEGSKDLQSTMQICRRMLSLVEADRRERQLEEVGVLKLWADNAKDLKGGDGWDQWQKELEEKYK